MNTEETITKPKKSTKELKEPKAKKTTKTTRTRKSNNKINGSGTGTGIMFTESNRISTQPNFDPSYTEIGIIHMSKSVGVNAIQDIVAGVANFFGHAGGMDGLYNDTRSKAITEILSALKPNQKLYNLKIDIGSLEPTIITFNLYGTLFEKVQIQQPQQALQQQALQQRLPLKPTVYQFNQPPK